MSNTIKEEYMPRQLSRRRPVNPEPEEDDEDEVQGDYQEDEAPSRPSRRRVRDEDEEGARPTRKRRRPVEDDDDEDEEERPRRFKGKRDQEEREARESRRKSKRPASVGKSSLRDGWGDGKMKSRDFDSERFTLDEDTSYVFRFAEKAPISSWYEHFLRDLPSGTKKSYVCAEDECPVCQFLEEEGQKDGAASFRRAFNVIVFDKKGNPEVKYWVTTPAVITEIEKYAFDKDWVEKHGPLNNPKTYFKIVKTRPKKNAPFKFRLDFIRSRDLEEEENIVPLDAGELEDLEQDFFTKKDVVKVDDLDVLEEVVETLGG